MRDKTRKTWIGKPQKFILHMAQHGNDWAGKAVNYDRDEECNFKNMSELIKWLNTLENRT